MNLNLNESKLNLHQEAKMDLDDLLTVKLWIKTFYCVSERTIDWELLDHILERRGARRTGDLHVVESDKFTLGVQAPAASISGLAKELRESGFIRETRQGANLVVYVRTEDEASGVVLHQANSPTEEGNTRVISQAFGVPRSAVRIPGTPEQN